MTPTPNAPDHCLIHRAVEDLIIATGACIDRKNFQDLHRFFHADARLFRPTSPDPLIGPEAIAESYWKNPENRLNRHLVSNLRLQIDSTTDVRADSYVTLYSTESGELAGETFGAPLHRCLIGEFHDRCVQTDAGWRIIERRAEFIMNMPVTRTHA